MKTLTKQQIADYQLNEMREHYADTLQPIYGFENHVLYINEIETKFYGTVMKCTAPGKYEIVQHNKIYRIHSSMHVYGVIMNEIVPMLHELYENN